MRINHFYLFCLLLLSCSCTGQKQAANERENKKIMAEKLDFEFLDKHAEKRKLPSGKILYNLLEYKLEDGTLIDIHGDTHTTFFEKQRPPLPAYWIYCKVYYKDGTIKERGYAQSCSEDEKR